MDNACEVNRGNTDIVWALNQSLLSEEVIDTSLKRQYEGLVCAGYFQNSPDPTGFRSYGWDMVNTEANADLATQSATDGMVLLKNDGILPLRTTSCQTAAMIGMWADDRQNRMLGNYFGKPPIYRTPLWAATQMGMSFSYADGPGALNNTNHTAAIEIAKAADTIIYFGGIHNSIEAGNLDRHEITWPAAQLSLLSALPALEKLIVVVQLGNQLDNTPLLNNPAISAILWAEYPGMNGGITGLDVLTEKKVPAGRLSITQYLGEYVNQVNMTDMTLRPSAKNSGRTYR